MIQVQELSIDEIDQVDGGVAVLVFYGIAFVAALAIDIIAAYKVIKVYRGD